MSRKINSPVGLVALSADPTGTYAGETYWNTTLGVIRTFNGTIWTDSSSGGTQRTFAFFSG